MTKDQLKQLNLDYAVNFLKADGFDDAIIGVCRGSILVYDKEKVIEALEKQGMSNDEAWEFFEYNIEGAYVGEQTPIFVELIK